MRKTTVGWLLLVKWKDYSESWISFKDMKESHPVETAEYAKAQGIRHIGQSEGTSAQDNTQ
eukprot:10482321-Ditylum_brightwellii.AAC.1